MRKKEKLGGRKLILTTVCVLLVILSAVCFGLWGWLSNLLDSQKEAERWQGEGELEFSQISCFLPADELIGLKEISDFRIAAMTKLRDASMDVNGDQRLMLDAWSTTTKLAAAGSHGKGDASAIAVGGDFFEFHPIRLLDGDYLRQTDLMEDRILVDEELAWLLYGGTNLQGLPVKVNGVPFLIAGVVSREQDFASKKAYADGMGLYMSYEGLLRLDEEAKINCYEFVLAEPVKGFALNAAREKFPIGRGEIVCNNTRYEYGKLMDILLQYGSRSTQSTGVIFPYWENAARMTEDWASLCCMGGTLLLVFPAITGAIWLTRSLKRGKAKLEDDLLPEAKERTEEAIRAHQRKRWEKKHGTQ